MEMDMIVEEQNEIVNVDVSDAVLSCEETTPDMSLKYKGVFTNNNNSLQETLKINNVNSFLEKESKLNKSESWNKRDKTEKIKMLNNYVDSIVLANHKLSTQEVADLKKYLVESIDKKKLQHVKDVTCDKLTGKIICIPTLHFNNLNRKFTLKRTETRVSTLKSLGKGKKHVDIIE